jgi:invasion protein IalB
MMDLTTPVSIAVDEEQVSTLQYNACNNQACFILRTDDEVLLNNFRAGQIAVLTMRSYAGEEIQINISLSGFGAALEVLHAE